MSSDLKKTIEMDDVIGDFECPVCRGYMHPPILQCDMGHSCCHNCYPKLSSCPTCRGPLSKCVRNWSLEKIHAKLQFPCKHDDSGCETIVPGTNIILHELKCKFRTVKCPMDTIHLHMCNWEGSVTSTVEHCQSHHAAFLCTNAKKAFIREKFALGPRMMYDYFFSYFYVHEEFFIYTWSINYLSGFTKWCVFRVDTGSESTFDYAIEIQNDQCKDRIYWRSKCPVVKNEYFNEHLFDSLVVHYEMITHYCVDDNLAYTVTIIKN